MSLPSFDKILESEFRNYEISKKRYEDIITWGERLKEILCVRHIKDSDGVIELTMLTNIIGNAFITAILLTMKCHVFHAYSVTRLGVEAFIQLTIIELNFGENLKVWRDFNYLKSHTDEWNRAKNDYNDVFRKKRKSYDYSRIIDDDERNEIVSRWNMLSEVGSHVNFIQTLFSFSVIETPENIEILSGIFDITDAKENHMARYLIWMIDTYFIISKTVSKILESHDLALWRSCDEIERLWSEWIEFKVKKAAEFGFSRQE